MSLLNHLAPDITARMAAAQVPGLAIALVRDGAVADARGFGVTSIESEGQPITPQTLFQIGSTTKPLTGTMIMRLVATVVLDLDRPITAYLPALTFAEPGAVEQVTLRLLLSHTAGLPWDQITPTRLYGRRDLAGLADYIRDELPTRPLVAPPGTRWEYSNPSINLAARIAEVATGRYFPELIADYVTAPLGMTRTIFDPAIALTYPTALSHDRGADGPLTARHRAPDNTAQYPSAFAYSTVLDLAKFALLHLQAGHAGGRQLLPPDLIAAMHTAQPPTLATAYGLTFMLDTYREHRRISHLGGIATHTSQFDLLPDHGLAVIILVNRGDDFAEHATAITSAALDRLLDD